MKKFIFILLGLLLLGAIPLTVYFSSQRQELRKRAAPATSLSLTPSTLTKKIGDSFSLDVTIDTATNQVVAAEIHIIYDATKLEAETITNGPLFPNILAAGTVQPGEASITVGALSTTSPIKGTGTVAIVKFKALAATTSPVSVKFSPATFVGSLGEGANNVLINSSPATITLTSSQQSSTPTLTPTPTTRITTSLTPTRTNSTTPTLSPTPSSTHSSQTTNLTLTAPATDDALLPSLPSFRGTASPNTIITLTVYSPPETYTISTNSSGVWSYTLTSPLATGPHSLTVTTDGTNPQTLSRTFIVGTEAQNNGTQSAIPKSGNITTTLTIITLGAFFLLSGLGAQLLIH